MAKNNNNVIGIFRHIIRLNSTKRKIEVNDGNTFFYSSGCATLCAILKYIELSFDKFGEYCSQIICVT